MKTEKNSNLTTYKINKEMFFKILEDYENQMKRVKSLESAGLNIGESDLVDFGFRMFEEILKTTFNSEGYNWITWWLYEKRENPKLKAYDEDHDEIPLETKEDLWIFVKKYRI